MELVRTAPGQTVSDAIAALEADPRVAWAEPNYIRAPALTPNDTSLGLQWALENTGQTVDGATGLVDADIDAPAAWDVTTGSPSVVVAVLDTGTVLVHPDLAGGLWKNPGEVADGQDNDGNDIIDDIHGADFTGALPDGDPTDALAGSSGSHGTHVAGSIVGTAANGMGTSGVAPGARVMPLRFMGPPGAPGSTVADEIEAIAYARAKGAQIVNGSYGSTGISLAERQAIAETPGALFVFAAGNGGPDVIGDDVDSDPSAFYPCAYDLPNIICVGASNESDQPTPFSNYGATRVDLVAPGTRVLGPVGAMKQQLFDGFESPLANWSANGTWGIASGIAAGGSGSLSDSPVGNYPALSATFAELTPPLSFSGSAGCHARLDTRLAMQPIGDEFLFESSVDDGTTWAPNGKWSGTTDGAFVARYVDLSGRDGASTVRVRLALKSDGVNEGDGAWVDNVDVSCLAPAGDYTGAAREFGYRSGTSMATPLVAGVAALVQSTDLALSPAAVKARILNGVDVLPAFSGKSVTGGRLNARWAVSPELIPRIDGTDVAASSVVLTGGPSILQAQVPPLSRPQAKPGPCAKFKGVKKRVCIRRQVALKKCARLKAGAVKRKCSVRARGIQRAN
jgi:thermitase